jgi:hypothetical protein
MLFCRPCALLPSPTHILSPLHLPLRCTNYLFCTIHTHTASQHPPVSFKPSSRYRTLSLSLSPITTAFKSYTKFSVSSLHLFLTSCYSVGLAPYCHRQHTYSHHFIYLCDAHAFKKCTNYLFCTIHTHTASIHPPVSFKPSSRYRTCN